MRQPLYRRWGFWVAVAWLLLVAMLMFRKWAAIQVMGLGDTDDNLRFLQVRDWINGQGWFDLRQYRLGPPDGANIHWSRLVDLPLALMYLICAPFMSTMRAWQVAVTLAPMIPLAVTLTGLSVMIRRMIGRFWWPLAVMFLIGAQNALYMWMPLRIDHHGWQLAFLVWALVGMTDRLPRRGGITAGIATILSVAIGLEFIHYLLAIAALAVVEWIIDPRNRDRVSHHGLVLALGSGAMWLIFASNDNRLPVCDALSPVWLLVTMGGGGAMVLLPRLPLVRPATRLIAAGVAGGLIAALFVLLFPHCLGSPEGLTPELRSLWFQNIREVRSVLTRDMATLIMIITVPLFGLIGCLVGWATETHDRRARRWLLLAALSVLSCAMMLWQMRAAASAQVIGIVGACALAMQIINVLWDRSNLAVRITGALVMLTVISGLGPMVYSIIYPPKPMTTARRTVAIADQQCQSVHYLRQLTKIPVGTMLTHVDFGPRLVAMTHHKAIAGPYHRNGKAIVDVMRAFRGAPDQARSIVRRWHANYVLLCPGMPETTIYVARAPEGFYGQLMRGDAPRWLTPVALPKGSPYRLWRVDDHAI